jgi:hypothetical protein
MRGARRRTGEQAARLLRAAWASPCTLVGLLLALPLLLAGGRIARRDGTVEASLRQRLADCPRWLRRLPFRAITFGHVILAITAEELGAMRAHEHVHVRQYDAWGPLFFIAYPASSAWQWLCGRRPYWDNRFEVEARRVSGERQGRGPAG